MNKIFGERFFFFPKGLEIVTTYSKSKESICSIENEYGNAVRIAIKTNGKRKFLITSHNDSNVFMSVVLESLENTMSNQSQSVSYVDADKTIVVEKLTENLYVTMSSILTAPILHTIDAQFGEKYSFQTYLEEIKKGGHNLLDRKLGTAAK